MDDRYARFLLEEILPEVGKSLNLAQDGNGRAIGGASSGAICAFNAAWERPDAFSRVFSTIGTYVGLRGGHAYPTLVRKTEPKPLRVFLQDGSNDLNIYGGDWWMANQAMLSALEFAGYDVKHVWGDGAHDGKHGGAILPDALRWLWRDYPAPVGPAGPSKQPLLDEHPAARRGLAARSAQRRRGRSAATAGGRGGLRRRRAAHRSASAPTGSAAVFRDAARRRARALAFGPDGRLYAAEPAQPAHRGAGTRAGARRVVADGVAAHGLAVAPRRRGLRDRAGQRRRRLRGSAQGARSGGATSGIAAPERHHAHPRPEPAARGGCAGSPFVSSFQIQADGSLAFEQPYFHLHLAEGDTASGAPRPGRGRERLPLRRRRRSASRSATRPGRVNGIVSRPGRRAPEPRRLRRVRAGTSSSWPWAAALPAQDARPRRLARSRRR